MSGDSCLSSGAGPFGLVEDGDRYICMASVSDLAAGICEGGAGRRTGVDSTVGRGISSLIICFSVFFNLRCLESIKRMAMRNGTKEGRVIYLRTNDE